MPALLHVISIFLKNMFEKLLFNNISLQVILNLELYILLFIDFIFIDVLVVFFQGMADECYC